MYSVEILKMWNKITYEANHALRKEPILSNFYEKNILQHKHLSDSLSYILSSKLSTPHISKKKIQKIFNDVYLNNSYILNFAVQDIKAIFKRDPVVTSYLIPFLYLKGFHALEAYRLSHYLWNMNKNELSMYFQSRISTVFSVDIHPAASIGSGVMLDHATGIVIGESSIIEDEVSILHSVTLGATGKNSEKDRHPKIRKRVIIGAGAKILGNIEVGLGAKIGAGSIVLKDVPSYVTVAGVPARIISELDSKKYFPQDNESNIKYIQKFQYGDGI